MWEKKQTWPLWSSTLSLFSVHNINQSSDFSNSPSKPSHTCMLLYIHSSFIHTLTHSTVLCFLSSCGSPTMNKVWKTFPLFVVCFFCFVHVIFNITVYTVLLTQMPWGRTRQICEDWGRWGGGLLDALDLWFSHSIGEVTACWRGSSRILSGLMETQNRPSTGRFLHSMEWNLKRECPEAWQGQPWTFNLFHASECSSRAFGRLDNGHPENSWMTGMIKGPIRHLSLISWYEALVASWLHPFLSHRGPRLLRVMKSQCKEREEGDIGGSRNAL